MPKIFSKWRIKNARRGLLIVAAIGVPSLPSLYFLEKNHHRDDINLEEREFVSQHVTHFADLEEGVLITDSIQLEKTALEDSNRPFIIALYLIESMRGGNSDEMVLSIFEKQGDKLELVSEKIISNQYYGFYGHFEIKDKKIILSGYKVGEHDALCCPSIPVSLTVKLQDRQLVPLQGQFLSN